MKRMKMISVSVLVAGVLVMGVLASHGSVANAQAVTKAESKPSVIVGGFSIARGIRDNAWSQSMSYALNVGTNVSLYVSMPGKKILELDRNASKLTKFTDDKGTVLAKPGNPSSWIGSFRNNVGNTHSFIQCIRSIKRPAAGALALTIDATLAITCGVQTEIEQCDGVSLIKGTPVKLGKMDAKIKSVGKMTGDNMKLSVVFSSSQSFATIRKLVFLDSAGKEIESCMSGSGSTIGPTCTYSRNYRLAKEVDKVTIKVDYWGKTETVTVPVLFNVQMGL
jgi:hypothetical protein